MTWREPRTGGIIYETEKNDNLPLKITIVKDGVPKEVTVTAKLAEVLEDAYANSNIYGLGGSTAKKLKDFFAKELAEFQQLVECDENQSRSKAMIFCKAFHIYSNESPLLVEALQWVEEHMKDENFSSRSITMDTIMGKEALGYRMDPALDFYAQLVADFGSWTGRRLIEANLRVSFVRFLKWFYVLIK